MPYGQDPTTPPDDALKRRGGYGRDPTAPPIATPSTSRSQSSLLERQRRGEAPEGPERETAGEAFQELRHGTLEGAGADILRGGKEIVQGAGNLVGNFFKALLPTEAGARAGGDVVRQLGDIGTFVSGGLTNPLMPQQGAGLARGINVTPPRVAQVPRPGAALPPPRTEVPGQAPTIDQPYPLGQRGTVEVPQGIRSPIPLTETPAGQRSTLEMGEPQRLALPAPRVELPGQQIPTGPGQTRPAPPTAGWFPYTPPPATGLLPRPGGTMLTPPGASPPVSPGLSFRGQPGRTSAEIAGERAGRDLPPRAPGTEGRSPLAPERQARQQTSIDSFLDDAARGPPSQLASAFVSNDPTFPNRAMTRQYRQIVGRGQIPKSGRQLDLQDQQISTAIDTMIENKDRMQFRDERDPFGNAKQPAGRVPQNLNEFVQGIDQMETEVFRAYDQMSQGAGVRIETAPAVAKLREIATSPVTEDLTPNIQQQALALAERLEKRGSYTPLEAQNVIQNMNAQLRSFKKTGSASHEVFSHPSLMDSARDALLETLNSRMTQAFGDNRYQVLRLRYQALASIKANVANALSKELSKTVPGFLHKTWTPVELLSLAAGAAHLGPIKGVAYPAAIEIGRQLTRYLNNPNRAVAAMFNARARELAPRAPYLPERLSAGLGGALSEQAQRRTDRLIMNPYVGPSGL